MNKIKSTYTISQHTLALLPARNIDFDTIAIERNKRIHIRQTALQLIKEACDTYWTTYEGRRQAVINHTNFREKTPIPISLYKRKYFFPTHSPSNRNNCWIAYQHIAYVTEVPKHPHTKHAQAIIHFKNNQTLTLPISKHTIRKQMNRTFECMYRIERMKKRPIRGM